MLTGFVCGFRFMMVHWVRVLIGGGWRQEEEKQRENLYGKVGIENFVNLGWRQGNLILLPAHENSLYWLDTT
jgi:hypothetical protein